MMEEFTGQDLSKAWDDGARARLQDIVDTFEEIHKYGDTYEVREFLITYISENGITGIDTTKLEEK